MKVFERYFQRNPLEGALNFQNNPEVMVIIPVFNDREIFATIDSLSACSTTEGQAGIIIVVNYGEKCEENLKAINRNLAEEIKRYVAAKEKMPHLCFSVIEAFDLPDRQAGVGLARKIAMDAAAYYFYQTGKIESPILSLDADTLVETNYLDETIRFFRLHPVAGVSIAYEHRLEDLRNDPFNRTAMIKYELYLHYYRAALAYTGHPYAFHCIGSAFAVRAIDYVAEGGMNKRQAGEDFYFLQKLIATGRYATLHTTKVYPSARFSDRTPFGTGQAVRQIVENGGAYSVYHFGAFRELKSFFSGLPTLFRADEQTVKAYFDCQPLAIHRFLDEITGEAILEEVNANCASEKQFRKRFFDRFNAFRVLKYLNYAHLEIYRKEEVMTGVKALFIELNLPFSDDPFENLQLLRNHRSDLQ
ncbi:MAG: hypothetical protein RR397_03820 [Odoribacter sp.]